MFRDRHVAFLSRFSFVMKLKSNRTAVVSTFATLYPAVHAGISNLQVYAGNTRARTDVVVTECQYCRVHNGEGNYAENYFSHAMPRTAGTYDSCVGLAEKSSGFLLQNNIFGRLDERMPDHSTISRTR
jgi:hypothetical protein